MEDGPWRRLKEARLRAGFRSSAALARAVGMPKATVASHERSPSEDNHRGISVRRAQDYGRVLKIDWRWLLYGDAAEMAPTPPTDPGIALPADIPDMYFILILRTLVEGLSSSAVAVALEDSIAIEGQSVAELTNQSAGKRPDAVRVTLLVRGMQAACEELLSFDGAPPLDRARLAAAAALAPELLRVFSTPRS